MSDADGILEIHASPLKTVLLMLGSLAFAALAAAMMLGWFPDLSDYYRFVGFLGFCMFGPCSVLWAAKLVRERGPVVTLSPQGLRDIRIAPQTIPWTAIWRTSVWETHGTKFILLDVDPEFERQMTLSRIVRWTRGGNRSMGIQGLSVATTGLKISHDTLFSRIAAQVEAAHH